MPWYRIWVYNSKTGKWSFAAWAQGEAMSGYVAEALVDSKKVIVYAEQVPG